jgi:hypothetical protein
MLMLCGQFREDLLKEVLVNDKLNEIAQEVKDFAKDVKDKNMVTPFLQSKLPAVQIKYNYSYLKTYQNPSLLPLIHELKLKNS